MQFAEEDDDSAGDICYDLFHLPQAHGRATFHLTLATSAITMGEVTLNFNALDRKRKADAKSGNSFLCGFCSSGIAAVSDISSVM
jgi:hypothetical protein